MREDGAAPSLAVLIDADNTSARYAQALFEEIVKLEANERRIYADFSGGRLDGWDGAIQSLAILQHQQRSNTKGRNAADIAPPSRGSPACRRRWWPTGRSGK